jgi:hypothetical protein
MRFSNSFPSGFHRRGRAEPRSGAGPANGRWALGVAFLGREAGTGFHSPPRAPIAETVLLAEHGGGSIEIEINLAGGSGSLAGRRAGSGAGAQRNVHGNIITAPALPAKTSSVPPAQVTPQETLSTFTVHPRKSYSQDLAGFRRRRGKEVPPRSFTRSTGLRSFQPRVICPGG